VVLEIRTSRPGSGSMSGGIATGPEPTTIRPDRSGLARRADGACAPGRIDDSTSAPLR
jgi:hypothetical protein